MPTRVLLFRLVIILLGALVAGRKILRYRRDRQNGLVAYNPRLVRAGKFAAGGGVVLLVGVVLLPLRIEMGWPSWLFYPFFAPMLIGMACLYYAAFLFWGAKTAPDRLDHDRVL